MPRSTVTVLVFALLGSSGCISPPTRDPETADGRKITVRISGGGDSKVTLFYANGRFTHGGREGRLSRSVARQLMREAKNADRQMLSSGPLTTTCVSSRSSRIYRIHRMPAGWDTQGWNGGPVDLVVADCSDALRDDARFFQALAAAEREIGAQLGEAVRLTPEARWRGRYPRVTVPD